MPLLGQLIYVNLPTITVPSGDNPELDRKREKAQDNVQVGKKNCFREKQSMND